MRLEHSDEKNQGFQVMKMNVTMKVGIIMQYMSARLIIFNTHPKPTYLRINFIIYTESTPFSFYTWKFRPSIWYHCVQSFSFIFWNTYSRVNFQTPNTKDWKYVTSLIMNILKHHGDVEVPLSYSKSSM